jgi:hypothetical protein
MIEGTTYKRTLFHSVVILVDGDIWHSLQTSKLESTSCCSNKHNIKKKANLHMEKTVIAMLNGLSTQELRIP